jgi:hypothetical protein
MMKNEAVKSEMKKNRASLASLPTAHISRRDRQERAFKVFRRAPVLLYYNQSGRDNAKLSRPLFSRFLAY